jgi:glycosyltransferase involved in cell wall biosynthesis
MSNKDPEVSVIIPTYNRSDLLSRAIRSVLNQTYRNFELIIVDDGSTDNTKQIVGEYQKKDKRIIYIWEKNSGGPAKPKNTGIQNSKGKYIAFLDDDDEWLSKKLEKQIKLFKISDKNLGFIGCNAIIINELDKKICDCHKVMNKKNKRAFNSLLEDNIIHSASSIIVKKKVLNNVGFFDENFKYADDWDLWLRISKFYAFSSIPDNLYKYRVHGKNTMKSINLKEDIKVWENFYNKHKKEYLKYPNGDSEFKKKLAFKCCLNGQFHKGRKYYFKSIKLNPLNIKSYLYLLLTFFCRRAFKYVTLLRK